MKKLALFFFVAATLATAVAQEVTIRFTGRMTGNAYIPLDSVEVVNVTRGWTEVLVWPDTVLTFNSSAGISNVSNSIAEMKAFPNPFNGNTNLCLRVPEGGDVSMSIYNLAGQKVAEYYRNMESGAYLFDVALRESQVYICAVQTSRGRSTVKLVNRSDAGRNAISLKGLANSFEKRLSANPFQPGDMLRYIGHATSQGPAVEAWPVTQEQYASEDITLMFSTTSCDLKGWFSVSSTKQVRFSPGNLQWSATGGGNTRLTHGVRGGGTADGVWRFAPNQWDVIGYNNAQMSANYQGWIDLIGWGTSCYNGKYPYMTSLYDNDYGNGMNSLANTDYDWGHYNDIYNLSTRVIDSAGTWRTLTYSEWCYLFQSRAHATDKYGAARVNGVDGVVVLPDEWTQPSGITFNSGMNSAGFGQQNTYTLTQWQQMEIKGAVFLPAAGNREGLSVVHVGSDSHYWSTTYYDSGIAYNVYLDSCVVNTSYANFRHYGFSVRLVRDVN